jgi:uncharacterized protein (DUF736 family)
MTKINTKNFVVSKNIYKKSDKQPDYQLSAKIDEKYLTIGSAWLKEGKQGKYFSVQLKEGLAITGELIPYVKKEEGFGTPSEDSF